MRSLCAALHNMFSAWGSCARLAVRYYHVGRVVVCGGVARVGVGFVWRSARLRAGAR